MTTKKVDLVVHEKGERKVIGEAVIDLDAADRQYLDFSGVVTDPAYRLNLKERWDISLNVTPFCASVVEGEK
jgi:hypothetical protein